jgi:predicted neutral ceramidase superfamily lipid hydrolase
MKNLPYWFLSVAVLQALAGMGVGIFMGITGDYALAPAHAHSNLLGWVSMAIFGLYYALVPDVAAKRPAMAHFWLALVANIAFPIGIGLVVTGKGEMLSVIGSLLEVLSMLLFGLIVWTNRESLVCLAGR